MTYYQRCIEPSVMLFRKVFLRFCQIFDPKCFLSAFSWSVWKFGIKWVKLSQKNKKCTEFPQNFSEILEWGLNSFPFLDEISARVHVSYKVISYKNVCAFTRHTTPLQMLLSNQIDILELLLAHRPDTTNQIHTFESWKGIIINLKVWFGV